MTTPTTEEHEALKRRVRELELLLADILRQNAHILVGGQAVVVERVRKLWDAEGF